MGSSGVKGDALSQYGTNRNTAASTLGQISPVYQQYLTGTDGLTPKQMSDMYTVGAQSSGGGQAAAIGAGNLLAARDGNAGGFGAAISDAARTAGDRNSATALGIQNQSTQLEDQRQQDALRGLSAIYGGADEQANANLGTANNAAKPFWQTALLAGIQSAGQVGAAAAGKP